MAGSRTTYQRLDFEFTHRDFQLERVMMNCAEPNVVSCTYIDISIPKQRLEYFNESFMNRTQR